MTENLPVVEPSVALPSARPVERVKVKWRPASILTVSLKGFGWLLLAVVILLVLGWIISLIAPNLLVNAPNLNKAALDSAAYVLAAITAICFAYSDTSPTAEDPVRRAKQESARDWVKLFTHGGAIVVTSYVAWSALGLPLPL